MELLAERGVDVSNRTVLRWVQTFGPQLAVEARQHRRPLGRRWYTGGDVLLSRQGRHVPTRDRLRASRGLKTLRTSQRFLGRFRVVCARCVVVTSGWQTCYRPCPPRPAGTSTCAPWLRPRSCWAC